MYLLKVSNSDSVCRMSNGVILMLLMVVVSSLTTRKHSRDSQSLWICSIRRTRSICCALLLILLDTFPLLILLFLMIILLVNSLTVLVSFPVDLLEYDTILRYPNGTVFLVNQWAGYITVWVVVLTSSHEFIIDFTHPNATAWLKESLQEYRYCSISVASWWCRKTLPVDAAWTDMNELAVWHIVDCIEFFD